MPLKISNLFVAKETQLDMWQMLMHCAIKLQLARIDAESIGKTYDRNEVIYSYFVRKKASTNPDWQRSIDRIVKTKAKAAWCFDQYFLVFFGVKPSDDANDPSESVKEGLKRHGLTTTF